MHSSPIEISIQSSKAVQPGHGSSSSEWDSHKAIDVVPLSVLDELYDEYMSSIHAFHPPAPSNAILEAGLARALAEYREWAGRLVVVNSTGRRAILLNDAGARFVEATADVALGTIMPLLPTTPVVRRLHPSCDDGAVEELMLVQITRFACGSLVVGHTMHHTVGDGFAICHCLLAWGQATRNVAIDPVPVHDRRSLFVPHDPPQVLFEHRGKDFKVREDRSPWSTDRVARKDDEVVTHVVRFSREFMTDLKSRASAVMLRPYSTLQCLVAHLWRCMTKARGLDGGGGQAILHIAVNGRARMSCPLVPMGYTGNAVLWAHPTTTVRELLARPLGQASDLIRREVARVDDAYFRSFVNFVKSVDVKEEGLVSMADAAECLDDGEVYCLRGIPFYDLYFGGGQQFLFMPSYRPVDGLIYILPSAPFGDGSVEAQVSLFSRVMDTFKDYCCSLF